MPRTLISVVDESTLDAAVGIWQAARRATDRLPSPERTDRVRAKISGLDAGAVALVAHYGERVAGMLVAEPYVENDAIDPRSGHISMVFVEPAYWGCGIGGALLRALQHGAYGPGWSRLSVWTRDDNRRGRRLYAARDFRDTGERASLHEGDVIERWEWRSDEFGED